MIVSWSPPALRKLGRIVQHIALEDPDAAWRVHARIVERAAQLAEFPDLGPVGLRRGTRELVVGDGAPYVLAYRVTTEHVNIIAVWHTRQSRKGQR